VKRRAAGHDHGVALVAEGVGEKLDPAELGRLEVGRDAYGNVRLAELGLSGLLSAALKRSLGELGLPITVVAKDIGYELRCAKPVAFDVEYARTLGYGAVRYLLGGGSGAMVALRGGKVTPVTLQEMTDPLTGRIRVRLVDTRTEAYQVGRTYMIRLEPVDLEEPRLSRLAAAAGMDARQFQQRFEPVVHRTEHVPSV
jgi:6-phosphofructokinase